MIFRQTAFPHTCAMQACVHEAAYAEVTVVVSEILHRTFKVCWLTSESPFLRGYSILLLKPGQFLTKRFFLLTHPRRRRSACSPVHVLKTQSLSCVSPRFIARRRQPFLPHNQFLMTSIKCLWCLYLGLGAAALYLNCDYLFR